MHMKMLDALVDQPPTRCGSSTSDMPPLLASGKAGVAAPDVVSIERPTGKDPVYQRSPSKKVVKITHFDIGGLDDS